MDNVAITTDNKEIEVQSTDRKAERYRLESIARSLANYIRSNERNSEADNARKGE